MGLETGTYIDSLDANNPVATDDLGQADDHLKLIKSTIKASFPGVTGAVTSTHTELNLLDGETAVDSANTASAIVKRDGSGNFAAGTITGTVTSVTATDNTADETCYLTFVDGATGSQGIETNTSLTYNPSTGVLSAPTLSGSYSTTTMTITDETGDDTECYPLFTQGATGVQTVYSDAGALKYNASNGALSATTFIGALTGNVTGNLTGDVTGTCSSYCNTSTATNVGGGYNVFNAITSGSSNVVFGSGAGALIQGGSFNAGVGHGVLGAVVGGGKNSVLGYASGSAITSGENNICVGYGAGITGSPSGNITTGSNQACYGDNNITDHYMAGDLHLTTGNLISATKTPSSASDTGEAGMIAWDSSYIYVCTATDTWKRVAISTW